jgi:hypothetical protein
VQKAAPVQAPMQKAVQAPVQKAAPLQAPMQKAVQGPTQKAVQSPAQSPHQKGGAGQYASAPRGGLFAGRFR